MIDTHCHLSMVLDANKNVDYNQIDEILKQMKSNNVTHAITIGSNMDDSKLSIDIAGRYNNIYCAIGVHPDGVEGFDLNGLEALVELNIGKGKIVAIGEIGLDYYWRKDNKDRQKEIFKQQLRLSKKYNLPVVIHCRDAYGDTLQILKELAPFNAGGVIHCYSGSIDWAMEVMKLGFLISFTGVVTYPNASNVQEVAKWVDDDKFMVETDSPFLTPVPFRGKKNDPSLVIYTANFIADLKGLSYDEIEEITTNNAIKLFKLQ